MKTANLFFLFVLLFCLSCQNHPISGKEETPRSVGGETPFDTTEEAAIAVTPPSIDKTQVTQLFNSLMTGERVQVGAAIAALAATIVEMKFAIESLANALKGISGVPVGTILSFAGASPPAGYLPCDGTAVRKDVYPALFAAIGTSWGTPDSDKFNVPDLRGTFLRGVDGGRGSDPDAASRVVINAGGNTGAKVGTLQNHSFRSHNHGVVNPGPGGYGLIRRSGAGENDTTGGADTYGSGTEPDLINAPLGIPFEGGSETRPTNAAVGFIIKY